MSNSLQPHEPLHTRPPCPSPTPGVYSNSCPLSWWCHPTISSSVVPFCSRLHSPSIRVFSNESALCIRWPKYWSFSFNTSPSNEHSELISFRMDWLDLLWVQGTLKIFSNTIAQKHQFLAFRFLYISTLTSIHDYWKTIAFTRWTFVSKVMTLLFNMLRWS